METLSLSQQKKKIKALRYLWQLNEQRINERNLELQGQEKKLQLIKKAFNGVEVLITQCEEKVSKAFSPGSLISPEDIMNINDFLMGQKQKKQMLQSESDNAEKVCEKTKDILIELNVERRLLGEKIEQKQESTIQMLNSMELQEVEDLFLSRMERKAI